jgi:hypothetical protein
MAQTGILDYQRYLNTLQTLNRLGQTFPSNQQTYNFSVAGGVTNQWTATISWETLILDQVSYSSKASGYVPNVDSSQVVGYFEGSTSTQYSTGVISIPARMYTGPMLPGGNYNVPLTVVHLSWTNGTSTYAEQIGFIQNWEPGVEIGDPTLDFNFFPVYSIPSTLTLTGEAGIVYGDNLTLVATTDMAIDLGVDQTRVRFYRVSTGTDVVLGNAYFTGTVATLVLPTNPSLPIGTYNIYAASQPRGVYRGATSNTINVLVESGVPLIITTSTFTPSLANYFPNHIVNYRLGVIPNPAFTASGVVVSNPVAIKLVNAFTPFTETTILSANFVAGQTNTNFTVQSSMIDVARTYPQTTSTITTSTQNSTQYTATLFVSNTLTVVSNWGYQTAGRYRAGSTSTAISVGTSTSVTVTGQAFPLTITQSSGNTYYDEGFSITVGTTTATYYTNISIVATRGTSTTVLFTGNNSGTSTFNVNNIIIATTGTYTITASYPGDLGSSLINANLASTSNTLTHIIRLGQDLLPTPIVTTQRTTSSDIIRITASTSTTLTNTLTYFYSVSNLGTSSWVRTFTTVATTVTTILYPGLRTWSSYLNGGLIRNWDFNIYDEAGRYRVTPSPYGWCTTTTNWATPTYSAFTPLKINSSRLFKYYDGSNYDLTKVTATNFTEVLDPLVEGTTWTTTFVTSGGGPGTGDPNIKWNYYDIYKIDTLGDTRGYNVIGLDASVYTGRTDMTEGDPVRLYFKVKPYRSGATGITYVDDPTAPTSGSTRQVITRYIDLVEYIGEITWNRIQTASPPPITVKLFKFTPTIPQTTREYRSNVNGVTAELSLPDPITTSTFNTPGSFPNYIPGGITITPPGQYVKEWFTSYNISQSRGNPPLYTPTGSLTTAEKELWKFLGRGYDVLAVGGANDSRRFLEIFSYRDWGKKQWGPTFGAYISSNPYAINDFYNEWFATFGVGQPPGSSWIGSGMRTNQDWYNTAEIWYDNAGVTTTTTYTYIPTDEQIGTLTLPYNTLPDATGVHVSWPGTTGLAVEYGRYNGFDIYTLNSPRVVAVTATNISVYGANSGETSLSQVEYVTSKVYPTNPVKLTATIQASQYQFDGGAAINTGTVQFINQTTGAVITTTNIVNSLATVYLYASNLTTSTVSTSATTGVSVIVQPRVVGATSASIATITLEVFNYSGFTYLSMNDNFTATNYSSAPSYPITNTSEPWSRRGIPTTIVKTFTRDPLLVNFVSMGGTIEIVAPYFVKGKDGYYNLGDYYPIYANVSNLYITVSSRTTGDWTLAGKFPAGYNDAMVTMTNSNVPGTYKKQSGWSGRYKISANSIQDKPNIVTLTFGTLEGEKLLWLDRQNWQDPDGEITYEGASPSNPSGTWGLYQVLGDSFWTTCDIRISVEGYDDLNNLVATLPANTLLGYKTNLYLRNMVGWQPPIIYPFI